MLLLSTYIQTESGRYSMNVLFNVSLGICRRYIGRVMGFIQLDRETKRHSRAQKFESVVYEQQLS